MKVIEAVKAAQSFVDTLNKRVAISPPIDKTNKDLISKLVLLMDGIMHFIDEDDLPPLLSTMEALVGPIAQHLERDKASFQLRDNQLDNLIFHSALFLQLAQIAMIKNQINLNVPLKNPYHADIFCNMLELDETAAHAWIESLAPMLQAMKRPDILIQLYIQNGMSGELFELLLAQPSLNLLKHITLPIEIAKIHGLNSQNSRCVSYLEKTKISYYLADTMLALVESKSADLSRCMIGNNHEKTRKELIDTLMTSAIIDALILESDEWDLYDPVDLLSYDLKTTSYHFSPLAQYAKNPVRCERYTVLNLLNTILNQLEDKEKRDRFFRGTAYPNNLVILTLLIIRIIPGLSNHHSDDSKLSVDSYLNVVNQIYDKTPMSAREFNEAELNLYALLHIVKRLESSEKDRIDDFENFYAILKKGTLDEIKRAIPTGTTIKEIDNDHFPLLATAVEAKQSIEVIQYLISEGVNINAINHDGRTALIQAIINRNDALFHLLMAHPNIDVMKSNCQNETALAIAIEMIRPDLATALLSKGATLEGDYLPSDVDGTNLLMYAFKHNMKDVVEHILSTSHINKISTWTQTGHLNSNAMHYATLYAPQTAQMLLFKAPLSRYALAQSNQHGNKPKDLGRQNSKLQHDMNVLEKFYPVKNK